MENEQFYNIEPRIKDKTDNDDLKDGKIIERVVMGRTNFLNPETLSFEAQQKLKDIEKLIPPAKKIKLKLLEGQRVPIANLPNIDIICDIARHYEFQPKIETKKVDKNLKNGSTFIRDLKQELANELELYERQINYYSTIDSPIDYLGVDGFFDIYLPASQNNNEETYHPLRILLDIKTFQLTESDVKQQSKEGLALFYYPPEGIDGSTEEGSQLYYATLHKAVVIIKNTFLNILNSKKQWENKTLKQDEVDELKEEDFDNTERYHWKIIAKEKEFAEKKAREERSKKYLRRRRQFKG